jgi:hypothetical protein
LRHDLDRPVRQIACAAADQEPTGFQPGAVPKKHTLDFPEDEKTADDFAQLDWRSVRLGRFWMLRVGIGKGGGSVALGFHRRRSRSRELLCLQVCFRTADGCLGSGEVRGCRLRRARRLRGGDGLPGVAHFLHGSPSTSGEAGNTDKYSNEAQHRVRGH